MNQDNPQSGRQSVGHASGDASVLTAEQVRQWFLEKLVDTYCYDEDFLRRRGRPAEVETDDGRTLALFDVRTERGSVFLALVAAPQGGAEAAEVGLRQRLLDQPHAAIGVCSDGTEHGTKIVRRRMGSNRFEYVSGLQHFNDPDESERLYTNAPRLGDTPTLEPLDERLEHVFFEAYSHFRDIDGLHANQSLDELCKLLLVKAHDERSTATGDAYRLQRARYGCTEEFAVAARELYDEATRDLDADAFAGPLTLSGEALEAAVAELAGRSVSDSPADLKGRAFQRVIAASSRAGMGQYFTPTEIIEFMVEVVAPEAGERVIDPFAGSAHFLRCARRFVQPGPTEEPTLLGLEKSQQMARVARTQLMLDEEGTISIRCADSLLDFSNYRDVDAESFDVVLTNPPFGSVLGRGAHERLADFELARGRGSVPLEVLGLERSVQLLRPGGRFGVVLPEGILANKSSRYVRDWLRQQVKLRAIIGLPVEAFSPFGASVKTSVIFGRKWRTDEERSAEDAAFLGRADSVGYDSSGTKRGDNELDALAKAARDFLGREGW